MSAGVALAVKQFLGAATIDGLGSWGAFWSLAGCVAPIHFALAMLLLRQAYMEASRLWTTCRPSEA